MKKSPKQTTKKAKPNTAKKAAPKPKKPTEIVITSPVNPSAQIVVASELADDSLIEKELMGEVLPYYIYQFCENKPACQPDVLRAGKCPHRKTTGISVKGVNETVRRLNRDKKSGYNIRISPDHIKIEREVEEDGIKGVAVTVYAENLIDGNSAWGTKFEPYKKVGRNGTYANTFAVEKALSKAERNAKRKLIPETVVVKMIEKLMTTDPNAVQFLPPANNAPALAAPVAPKPSSPAEIQQLIRDRINASKTKATVMEIDRKVQESDNFSKTFKKEIRDLASTKIDKLDEINI